VEHFLAPTLKKGQVVVLDGLGAHIEEREGKGAHRSEGSTASVLALLLAGLEPHIEEAFSKIKGLVRKVGARTRGALVEAIERALAAVTPEDAAGWFAHAGYWPQDHSL
jgi:hypothetical protein